MPWTALWVWPQPLPACAACLCAGLVLPRRPLAAAVFVAVWLVLTMTVRRGRPLGALLVPLVFAAAGAAAQPASVPSPLALQEGQAVLLEGIILEAPQRRPEGLGYFLQLSQSAPKIEGPWTPQSGRIAVYITKVQDGRHCGRPGDRMRVWAKPRRLIAQQFEGGFDGQAHGRRRGLAWTASAQSTAFCASRPTPKSSVERLRDTLHFAIERGLPKDQAAVVRAFATGDRFGLTRAVQEDFQVSGLSHLLAVSGLNLAIVAGLFVLGLRWLLSWSSRITEGPGAQRVAALIAIPAVCFYTLLVGASPSSVRAAVMVTTVLVATLLHRGRQVQTGLAAAVILMLALDPSLVHDVSFQLSVAAVVALLRGQPWLRKVGSKGLWGATVSVAACSFFASLGTAPLVAHHFGRVSLVGVLSNVPAAPLSSFVLVPSSLVGAGLASLNPELGQPLLQLAGWAADLLLWLARVSASVPHASLHVPRPTMVQQTLLVLGLWTVSHVRWSHVRKLGVLLLVGYLTLTVLPSNSVSKDELRITVLPVGQGDSAVIESGGGVVVIDTGPPAVGPESTSAVEKVVLPFLRARQIQRIDTLILTHPHADHVGGLDDLLDAVEVGEIWWTGDERDSQPGLLSPLKRTRSLRVGPGFKTTLGRAQLKILGPLRPASTYHDVNDGSLVVKLSFDNSAVLFTGDAEVESETELVEHYGTALRADILMLGHHGSRSSTTEPFLHAVQARLTIASCGRQNHFGFVHEEVLQRLNDLPLWRSDRDGAVTVRRQAGGPWRVSAYAGPRAGKLKIVAVQAARLPSRWPVP